MDEWLAGTDPSTDRPEVRKSLRTDCRSVCIGCVRVCVRVHCGHYHLTQQYICATAGREPACRTLDLPDHPPSLRACWSADWMGKEGQTGLFVFQTKTELPDTDTVTLPHSHSPVRAVLPSAYPGCQPCSLVCCCLSAYGEGMDGGREGRVRCWLSFICRALHCLH